GMQDSVSGSTVPSFPADFTRQHAHGRGRSLLRMMPPGIVYWMAARSHGVGTGRLILIEHHPGWARLRYSAPREDDRAACLRRQAWVLGVAERCGGKRVTLREEGCLAERQPSCEYAVSWVEPVRWAPAVIAGLVAAVALLAAASAVPVPVAAWLLLPILLAAAQALQRRPASRRNLPPAAVAGAAVRLLLRRARALRREPTAKAEEVTPVCAENAPPVLEQDGQFWRVGYAGTTVLLRHSRGLALLAHLVRCPGRDIHVRELDSITPSGGSPVAREAPAPDAGLLPLPGDGGELLDAQ